MNYLDVIIAIPLLFGAWRGYKQGLIFEMAMIIGLILGFYIGFKFLHYFEKFVSKYISSSGDFLPYLTFFIVLALVIALMILLAKMLEAILKITALNLFNQIAGAVFGIIKFALVLSFLLALFKPVDLRMSLIPNKIKTESVLYNPVLNIAHYLFPAIQDVKKEFEHRVGNS